MITFLAILAIFAIIAPFLYIIFAIESWWRRRRIKALLKIFD